MDNLKIKIIRLKRTTYENKQVYFVYQIDDSLGVNYISCLNYYSIIKHYDRN